MKLGAYLHRHLELTAAVDDATDSILIFPAGRVELFGMPDVFVDEQSAQSILAAFRERGVEIPVDYEHSTKLKAARGEESPAAGWITDMQWVPGRGLIGSVRWTDRARKQIKAKEYKYLSPHFDVELPTRRVEFVLAVSLTNTPRINNMEALVAASVFGNEGDNAPGGNTMKTLRERIMAALKLEGEPKDDEVVAAVEQVVAQAEEPPAEPTPEEQAAMVAKDSLMALQRALMEAGLIGADSTLQEAVDVAIGLIGNGGGSEEESASIAAALGLKGKPSTKEIVATIHERIAKSVPVDEVKRLKDEVASLTAERTERRANELVGSLVEDGKLNPHDEKNMTWARTLAKSDPDQLASLMKDAPALYKSDRVTPDGPASKTKRETVIASAIQDHKNERCAGSAKHYVNVVLDEEGLEHLTDDEAKTFSIA